jgi:hypothetical protein
MTDIDGKDFHGRVAIATATASGIERVPDRWRSA